MNAHGPPPNFDRAALSSHGPLFGLLLLILSACASLLLPGRSAPRARRAQAVSLARSLAARGGVVFAEDEWLQSVDQDALAEAARLGWVIISSHWPTRTHLTAKGEKVIRRA